MTKTSGMPKWFWAVAGGALVWNLLGVGAYVAQVTMSDEAIAALSEAEQALYRSVPAWATAAFATAVFGGAAASLLLLMRKGFATPVFGISLAGILVQMYHSFFVINSAAVYGPGSAVMPAMVLVIGAGLVWFSMQAKAKGWIA